MKINIYQLTDGAAQARGATVIIDVFRAFTVECHAFHQGAARVYPIGDIDRAYALKQQHPDYLLAGERKGRKMPGFDFGNSPFEVSKADLTGKTLVHTTSAGTQGIAAATGASHLMVAALVNAKATAAYIRSLNVEQASLVCMGFANQRPSDEDTACAEYIKALLEGAGFDKEGTVQRLREGPGARFFDPKNALWSPPEDFTLCCQYDRFPFALPVRKDENGLFYTQPAPQE